ncbi:MAG: glyoxalase [Flavobacteriaceae bacterium]|nr:glyoxalase [Flavobacteriaceae bacterium]|tara:strand:+ start:7260 stop:7685 length:426 start_codon:yes stop_codon:yes gene_type:complete
MKKISPFHLAIPVNDLFIAINFYENILGCTPGRKSEHWADYDFFGHQLVVHLDPNHQAKNHHNDVDGKSVPVPHFGVVLPWEEFDTFSDKLKLSDQIEFIIEPYLRFEGRPGEQKTLFFYDPAGNALEFKSFKNMDQLFKK